MKEKLALLKRLEEDCQTIQRSVAIIQSAQRILTFYTAADRRGLLRQYSVLSKHRRSTRDFDANPNSALSIFRQDHPDLALIADALEQGTSIDLSSLKLKL